MNGIKKIKLPVSFDESLIGRKSVYIANRLLNKDLELLVKVDLLLYIHREKQNYMNKKF